MSNRDRPAATPIGRACERCDHHFMGADWQSYCAICVEIVAAEEATFRGRYIGEKQVDALAGEKIERNARVQARYDELIREGKHGHYETMFRVVREEVERALATR